jgi:hypothetical protein
MRVRKGDGAGFMFSHPLKAGHKLKRSLTRTLRRPRRLSEGCEPRCFLFVTGLHKSGTTLLAKWLGRHPAVSSMRRTGVPGDEGQHLQRLLPPPEAFGGPGRFAFDRRSGEATSGPGAVRSHLLDSWARYFDPSSAVWVEKSPGHILRLPLLRSAFPTARFAVIVRHPVPVAYATMKWSGTTLTELLLHWEIAHRRLFASLGDAQDHVVVRYEELVADPAKVLGTIWGLVGLDPSPPPTDIEDCNAVYFATYLEDGGRRSTPMLEDDDLRAARHLGYSLEPPYVRARGLR